MEHLLKQSPIHVGNVAMSRSLRRTHSVKSRAFWPIILMASVLILGPILTCSASNKAAVVLDLKGMVLLVTLFDGE